MTFIGHNRRNLKLMRFFLMLGFLALAYIGLEIYTYSQSVGLKHDILTLSSKIELIRIENANLKNQLYSLTDQQNLDKLAAAEGLIKDNNPKWVFASHF